MKFKKGDIVWARAHKEPIWPAQVTKIEKTFYKVRFFNEGTTADLNEEFLFDFLSNRAKYEKSGTSKKFKEAINKADIGAIERKPSYHESSKDSKRNQSPMPHPKKRKRPEVIEEKIVIQQKAPVVKKGQVGRKKIKKTPPPEVQIKAEIKEEPDLEQIDSPPRPQSQSSSIAPNFRPTTALTADDVIDSPQYLVLKHLRRRLDRLLLELTLTTECTPKFTNQALLSLQEIPSFLKCPELKPEDLLSTKASSMIYFILKRLENIPEHSDSIQSISDEMEHLKDRIMNNWSNTSKLDMAYRNLKLQRARTAFSEDQ